MENPNVLDAEFLDDVQAQLLAMAAQLRSITSSGDSALIIQALYRAAHTIKGTASMLGNYPTLEQAAHRFESYLDSFQLQGSVVSEQAQQHFLAELATLQTLVDNYRQSMPQATHTLPVRHVVENGHKVLEPLLQQYVDFSIEFARTLGKEVRALADAGDIAVPAPVYKAIQQVLSHLVRNSIDHGIEAPQQRLTLGKPAYGVLVFSAVAQQARLVLNVSDDGAGLSRERVLRAVRKRGYSIDNTITDDALWSLVFEPGVTTAQQVSQVSGRGVGLDSVRATIEELGGSVRIESTPGAGATVSLQLPIAQTCKESILRR